MAALEWQLHAKILPATLVVREPRRLTYRVQRSGGRGTEQKEREKREREAQVERNRAKCRGTLEDMVKGAADAGETFRSKEAANGEESGRAERARRASEAKRGLGPSEGLGSREVWARAKVWVKSVRSASG